MTGESDVKQSDKPGVMRIFVQSEGEQEVEFMLKPETKMIKMMLAYCQKKGKDPKAVVFAFDGQRIVDEDTPIKLKMESGDRIDVFSAQRGGDLSTTAHC